MGTVTKVRLMTKADLDGAALVHQATFVRQQNSKAWLQCNLNAAPRFLNFVAESEGEVVGYIIWVQRVGLDLKLFWNSSNLPCYRSRRGKD